MQRCAQPTAMLLMCKECSSKLVGTKKFVYIFIRSGFISSATVNYSFPIKNLLAIKLDLEFIKVGGIQFTGSK